MENDNTKKIWEKPELKKLGLEMEHCCVVAPSPGDTGENAQQQNDSGFFG